MKMRKKWMALILCFCLGITAFPSGIAPVATRARAADSYTVSSFQKSNADEEEAYNTALAATGLYEAEIDGQIYTNYALRSTGKASAKCGSVSCNGIIDGNANAGYQAASARDIQSMTVDLGRTRSISRLHLSWETASARTYGIDFSLDGENWTTVAYVEDCTKTGARCDVICLTIPQNTRYVRFQGLKLQTSWAYNLWELSAYSLSGKADGADPISARTYTDEEREAIRQADEETKQQEEYDEYIRKIAGYIDTDYNLARGTAAYTTGYFNGEGRLAYLTDGNLGTKATTNTINSSHTQEYFVLAFDAPHTAEEIDHIYCQYGSNADVWGKDGFKLYAADEIAITTEQNAQDLDVIAEDETQWELLFEEDGSNAGEQNYYQPFVSDYDGTFRYLKLEYNRITKSYPYGIQLNEFALYAPIEEDPDPEPGSGEEDPLPSVTEKTQVADDSTVTRAAYDFRYQTAGFAAGTFSLETEADAEYSLYWGDGNEADGYGAITKNGVPYTALASVTTENGHGTYASVNDYLAIPPEATKLLVYNDKHMLQYVCDIPEEKRIKAEDYRYSFASVSDVHYNRYHDSGDDDALFAFDNALQFLSDQGIRFVGVCRDLSSRSEKDAYIKFREAAADHPELTVLSVKGNHDGEGDADTYFRQYVNRGIYENIGKGREELEELGILSIAENGEDFAFSPDEASGDVFLFLNQSIEPTDMTTMTGILQEDQLDWLEGQIARFQDRNIFLYFHTYLSTDDHSTTTCVGNVKSTGGYSYNLTYDVNAPDGERLRSIINAHDNVTMFNGHSHFTYDTQIYNPYVNIGTTSGTPFHSGATVVHVSSVTEPRIACADKNDRIELNHQASEGTRVDVYDASRVFTGIDFWNGRYEAYATYIDGDLPPDAATEQLLPGDVDGDGNVTVGDVLLVLKKSSGALSEEEGSGYRWELGDLNHDGAWTAVDALMILNRSVQTGAGKETG